MSHTSLAGLVTKDLVDAFDVLGYALAPKPSAPAVPAAPAAAAPAPAAE